eukprot:737649-Pyramimonas_sp.AAC.1
MAVGKRIGYRYLDTMGMPTMQYHLDLENSDERKLACILASLASRGTKRTRVKKNAVIDPEEQNRNRNINDLKINGVGPIQARG